MNQKEKNILIAAAVSFIVPIYNMESYLEKCLDSILGQTFGAFEVILVDDGSGDNSPRICDEYAEKDNRIKVIHKENGGLLSARKAGIKSAIGEYIAFIDSDDWIESDYLEVLLEEVHRHPGVKMVSSGSIYEYELEDLNKKITDGVEAGYYKGSQIREEILPKAVFYYKHGIPGMAASLWAKLIKKELLEKQLEKVDNCITVGEDGAVIYPLLTYIDDLSVLHYCGYHYLQRNNSMLHQYKPEYQAGILKLHELLRNEFGSAGLADVYEEYISQYVAGFHCRYMKDIYGLSLENSYDYNIYRLIPKDSKVILYGCGKIGKSCYRELMLSGYAEVVMWVDADPDGRFTQTKVHPIEDIANSVFDYILIAISNRRFAEEAKIGLLSRGVDGEKIIEYSKGG